MIPYISSQYRRSTVGSVERSPRRAEKSLLLATIFALALLLPAAPILHAQAEDVTAPTIEIRDPDQPFLSDATPAIFVAYADDSSGVDPSTLAILIDGVDITPSCTPTGQFASCESPVLAEGMHTIDASVQDLAGSTGTTSFAFTVDLTPPDIDIDARSDVQIFSDGFETGDLSRWSSHAPTSPPGGPPTLTLAGPRLAVDVTYTDALSGVDLTTLAIDIDGVDLLPNCEVGAALATCTSPNLAKGDHVITASISDLAGNTATITLTVTVESLDITITSPADGFLTSAATVDVSGTVDRLADSVTVNGVTATLNAGAFQALGVPLSEGSNLLEAVATRVGDVGTDSITVTRDSIPPEITATVDPPANAAGWHNEVVTVTFDCTDSGSGVATCTDPVTVTTEGTDQEVVGTAVDLAGNSATTTVTLNIDLTPPTIGATPAPPANAAGWNNTPVTVTFDCDDALSGVASCSDPVTLSSEGADQVATGTAVDIAGNSTTVDALVSIDLGAPTFDPAELRPVPCPEVTMDPRPQVQACFSDTVSGVDPATVTLEVDGTDRSGLAVVADGCVTWDPQTGFGPGEHQAEATATDLAGNVGSVSWCFEVALPPVAITIDSPVPNFLTRDDLVDVFGTVEDGVESVTVNSVAAQVSGTSFTALAVPLREGRNVITAVARTPLGNTGTANVVVLRDTTAPRLSIETPRPGAMLTSLQVDVAGLVNDLIAGTTINADDCDVTVNGIPATVANRSFVIGDLLLKRGMNTITAVATDRMGNSSTVSIEVMVEDRAGQRIVLLAGNNQSRSIFEELPDPLVVALEDANGDPVIGRPVRFQVSRGTGTLRAFPQEGSEITVLTNELGHASVRYELGGRSGAGNNRVLATASGFLGEVEFCADATPDAPMRIVANDGDRQSGAVEGPLPEPLVVLVTDTGGNPVGGVDVTFEVLEGGGSFAGSPTVVSTTDFDGLAEALWTLGPEPGINNNLVRATFPGLLESAATFTASAQHQGPPDATSLSGVVLDNQDNPVPGVTLTIEDTALSAVSDAEGQFSISGVPVGFIHLLVDGTTTTRPGEWPSLSFELTTTAGRKNTVGQPIYLLPLDMSNTAPASSTEDITLSLANVPGSELTVFANSVTCPDGTKNCEISVTQVRTERVPMEPPLGSTFMLAWTIQPAGAKFDPPARICIPNTDMQPGEQVEIFSFNHDQGAFIAVGTATVGEDGSQLCSDPGFGIVEGGWHSCTPPPPPQGCEGKPCKDQDPMDCKDISGNTCDEGGCTETNKPECTACGTNKMNVCDKNGQCIGFPTVSLSFRTSGSISSDNNCRTASCVGGQLGLLSSPVFKNVEEMQGTISPSGFNCATYDFKRVFVSDGEVFINGVRSPGGPTAGSSDDSHNADEDLTPENDHIYGVDGPTPGVSPGSAGSAGDTVVQRAKFREWVECTMNGKTEKCSSDFDWCFVISLKHDGTQWIRDPDGTNVIQSASSCF